MKELEKSNIFPTEKVGHDFVDAWMSQPGINVCRTVYHGSANFVGDQADRLMMLIESLEDLLESEFQGDGEKLITVRLYMRCFKEFRAVTKACFGTKALDPTYEQLIADFMATVRSLGWKKIPLKFHLVERHIAEFLKLTGEKWALGHYSEQVEQT